MLYQRIERGYSLEPISTSSLYCFLGWMLLPRSCKKHIYFLKIASVVDIFLFDESKYEYFSWQLQDMTCLRMSF